MALVEPSKKTVIASTMGNLETGRDMASFDWLSNQALGTFMNLRMGSFWDISYSEQSLKIEWFIFTYLAWKILKMICAFL